MTTTLSNGDAGQNLDSITTAARAHVKPDKNEEYEQWLHGIDDAATRFAGFQGATMLRPNHKSHRHPEYVVVVSLPHTTYFAVGSIRPNLPSGKNDWNHCWLAPLP